MKQSKERQEKKRVGYSADKISCFYFLLSTFCLCKSPNLYSIDQKLFEGTDNFQFFFLPSIY